MSLSLKAEMVQRGVRRKESEINYSEAKKKKNVGQAEPMMRQVCRLYIRQCWQLKLGTFAEILPLYHHNIKNQVPLPKHSKVQGYKTMSVPKFIAVFNFLLFFLQKWVNSTIFYLVS